MPENMNEPSTPEFPMISPSISNKSIIRACKSISRVVRDDSDDDIVPNVWAAAKAMFDDDQTLEVANYVEFEKKVESYPREDFMGRLRDIASNDSLAGWGSLLTDSMYSNFIPPAVFQSYSTSRNILCPER